MNERLDLGVYFGKSVRCVDGKERVCNIVALLERGDGSREIIPGANIVTDAGDKFYAEKACAQTPTVDFVQATSGFHLGTGSTSPTKSSTGCTTENSAGRKARDATYPKTADGDTDNTGAGADIVTWRVSYSTSEANITNIAEGAVVDLIGAKTAALCHFLFAAAFTKTSSDTLKVFVNHQFNGV